MNRDWTWWEELIQRCLEEVSDAYTHYRLHLLVELREWIET